MIAIAGRIRRRSGPKPDSLYSQVIAFVREVEEAGGTVTNAMMLERWPHDSFASLKTYRAAARKGGRAQGIGDGRGLSCEDDADRAVIEARIAEVRAEKIARGEYARPYEKRVMKLHIEIDRMNWR